MYKLPPRNIQALFDVDVGHHPLPSNPTLIAHLAASRLMASSFPPDTLTTTTLLTLIPQAHRHSLLPTEWENEVNEVLQLQMQDGHYEEG